MNNGLINEETFVISRTPNDFSAMGIDQCDDQLNKLAKGDGKSIDLTEDKDRPKVNDLWPQAARIVMDFKENQKNFVQAPRGAVAFQNCFKSHVDCL